MREVCTAVDACSLRQREGPRMSEEKRKELPSIQSKGETTECTGSPSEILVSPFIRPKKTPTSLLGILREARHIVEEDKGNRDPFSFFLLSLCRSLTFSL